MGRLFLLMVLVTVCSSANAKPGFTCEKIKDKETRDACIEDRGTKEQPRKDSKKAEISSTCTLNGRGYTECTFKNSGSVKGSSCEYIALMPIDVYQSTYFTVLKDGKLDEYLITAKKHFTDANNIRRVSSNDDLSNFVTALASEKMMVSNNPICSGIVEAGDIRQVTGTTTYFVTYDQPFKICEHRGGAYEWTRICSFTTIPAETIIAMLNEK